MNTILTEFNLLEVPAEKYFEHDNNIVQLKEKISEAIKEAEDITVLTASSVETASHYIKNFALIENNLEDARKKITAPILEKKKEIDSFFKKLILSFTNEKTRLEKDVLSWKRKQEEIARAKAEEERKRLEDEAIEAAIKKEEELKQEAIKKGEDPEKVKVEIPIVAETVIDEVKLSQKNSSGISSSKLKRFRLVPGKENEIPREYLIPDEKKIKELRSRYDAEAKSPFPWLEFYGEENLRRG
jgi:hypothetical protein